MFTEFAFFYKKENCLYSETGVVNIPEWWSASPEFAMRSGLVGNMPSGEIQNA
jgi:hypothetical protein